MARQFCILCNSRDARKAEVGLTPSRTRQFGCRPTRLIINDVIANRLLCSIKVSARKMVMELGQVFVARSYFCRENCFGHKQEPATAVSFWLKASLEPHCEIG